MKKLLLFIIPAVYLMACKPEIRQHRIQFYHWKSKVNLGETETIFLDSLHSGKLYIRVFDVIEKEGKPQAAAIIRKFDAQKIKPGCIPVVYMVNEVFLKISKSEIQKLTENVHRLTGEIAVENNFGTYNEIQIDCDWTEATRDNYFFFLKELKKISQKQISSTLRLHQVKYRNKTGIPPADKVYLMCYATSSPIEEVEKNSILDLDLLKDYLKDLDTYPLKMDVALPIYSWVIATNHIGKKKLINGVVESDLENENFRKIKSGLYEVIQDNFLRGIYLNQGFTVKVESISTQLLAESRKFLDSKIKPDFDIVYYHLDSLFLTRYSIQDLK